jgi:hypothetical protein
MGLMDRTISPQQTPNKSINKNEPVKGINIKTKTIDGSITTPIPLMKDLNVLQPKGNLKITSNKKASYSFDSCHAINGINNNNNNKNQKMISKCKKIDISTLNQQLPSTNEDHRHQQFDNPVFVNDDIANNVTIDKENGNKEQLSLTPIKFQTNFTAAVNKIANKESLITSYSNVAEKLVAAAAEIITTSNETQNEKVTCYIFNILLTNILFR